ncbi:MAG TPA: PEP-CTERM sorting domain-containing protein [Candidatus Limnocylindrales bacterium]|jgi:hypothetical protein|nr:PEP-CTERM sorting domain-containing protein [Candidatus Limnocylindrales bacterium]
MKKVILTCALGVVCHAGFAQGQLNFANFGAGANAPVYDTDGTTKLAGSVFAADLYWAPGVVTDSTVLTALGQPASFVSSGYFLGGTRTIPGQPGGATITGQVRIWDVTDGGTWEAVFASGSPTARLGVSVLFQITLTEPPMTPNSLTGLNGHYFGFWPAIPEPSTLAISGLGFVATLLLRRRSA